MTMEKTSELLLQGPACSQLGPLGPESLVLPDVGSCWSNPRSQRRPELHSRSALFLLQPVSEGRGDGQEVLKVLKVPQRGDTHLTHTSKFTSTGIKLVLNWCLTGITHQSGFLHASVLTSDQIMKSLIINSQTLRVPTS